VLVVVLLGIQSFGLQGVVVAMGEKLKHYIQHLKN
jgi:hypothetical protein